MLCLHFSALLKNRLTRLCFYPTPGNLFLVDLLWWGSFLLLFLQHLALKLFVLGSHSPAVENRPCLIMWLLGHLHQLEMTYKLNEGCYIKAWAGLAPCKHREEKNAVVLFPTLLSSSKETACDFVTCRKDPGTPSLWRGDLVAFWDHCQPGL